MSSSVMTSSGVVVVTQVYPQQCGTAVTPCARQRVHSPLEKFLKGEPKALGTVQIIIGVMNILFGIVMALNYDSVAVFSGIIFWGAIIYITAGALTVAADNKLNKCLVKGALVMNVFSTISAGIAIIIHFLDLAFILRPSYCPSNSYEYYFDCQRFRNMYTTKTLGITGIMFVFTLLEFAVSISVSAFGCKTVCNCASGIGDSSGTGSCKNLMLHGPTAPTANIPVATLHPYPDCQLHRSPWLATTDLCHLRGQQENTPVATLDPYQMLKVSPSVGHCVADNFSAHRSYEQTEMPPKYPDDNP